MTRGLVRIYGVDEAEYLEVVDWRQIQRVGKRARRRYPGDPSRPDPVPEPVQAALPAAAPEAPPSEPPPAVSAVVAKWRQVVGRALRRMLPNGPPGDTEQWIDHWIGEGYDLASDVLPAISLACRPSPDLGAPLGLAAAAAFAEANRARRLAAAPPGT
ncbi:MAG: hypothetical protein FJX20_09840 [Alphaproteobacteria bacterium]|nr:hypothetical protein [Alphaproteobacteria bacterium]